MFHVLLWVTGITGPKDSPYEKGVFKLEVQIPDRSVRSVYFAICVASS